MRPFHPGRWSAQAAIWLAFGTPLPVQAQTAPATSTAAGTAAATASVAANTTAAAPALAPLTSGAGALAPAWRPVGLPQQNSGIPATRFLAGSVQGQAGVQLMAQASYGSLVHDWSGPVPARLQWRWRLEEPLTGGTPPDIRSKAGDDAALKVCVMFDQPLERMPFVERTVLRMARSATGEALPGATLCYLWDSRYPAGTAGANPYSRRVRFLVLRGPQAALNQWTAESRDVAQDFIALFGDELPGGATTPRDALPPVLAVALGADADNTGGHSRGWIAQPMWGLANP